MNRRDFLKTAGLGAAAMAAGCLARGEPPAGPRRPNIIFILADDLGYADVGCYGQKRIHTPNIDRLAAEGVRFTQGYSGSTVCAPSRCALMTGYHTGHTFIRGNREVQPEGQLPMPASTVTIARVLKDAGYRTGCTGKWGLGEYGSPGDPNKMGFDHFFGYTCQRQAHSYYPDHLWRDGERVALDSKTWSHALFADEALKFVRESKDRPFFLYLAFTIPHSRYEVPGDEPYTNEPWPQAEKNYAAMITRMDADVGRLAALVKELGIDDNTIVFFASDNGAANRDAFESSGPLRGMKRDMYEGGIRVPMIVRWPGRIRAGSTSDQVWAFWDFPPTAAEIAGAKFPGAIDGISMLPAILGREQQGHEYLYWEFHERGFDQAVRMGDWKAVRLGPKKPVELYDLKADPGEKSDVAAAHPDIVRKMEELLKSARTDSAEFPIREGPAPGKAKGKAAATAAPKAAAKAKE